MPKVTVWLTSYNHEQFLAESIESVLSQTYYDYEFYIIDDCSSDRSWDIIQRYAKKDERIIAIRHSENWGESGLRKMVSEFQGEYVAIAHSDDRWLPDKLEQQIDVLDNHQEVAACFTLVDVIDDFGASIQDKRNIYYNVFERSNRTRYEWLNHFFYNSNCLCHPSVLIRKKAYTEWNILTSGLHGLPDFVQWIRLCKKADIYILQERLTQFRVHGDGSNTSGDNPENIRRVYTEEWMALQEFSSLIDTQEVIDVFPQTNQYIVNGKINNKFALAQVMLQHPLNSHKLYGLQLLYELFQDSQQEKEIEQLYHYSRKNYNRDKQAYDIFHVISENRWLQVGIYLSGENGYNEKDKISVKVFMQQTGAFCIQVDLSEYPMEIIQRIRVDLDEGRYRKFQIQSCRCADEDVELRALNGVASGEWDYFYTFDPQYEVELKEKGIFMIVGYAEEISGNEIELYYTDMKMRYDWMKCQYGELNEEITKMRNSMMWKIGEKIKRLLRK